MLLAISYNLAGLVEFLRSGGWTLPIMFGLSVAMWMVFLERAYFLRIKFPRYRKAWAEGRIELEWLYRQIDRGMDLARVVIHALPLLGLLGTVAGMIESFEALATFGNSNPRALSGGISHALISTMVGLVTSIAGLYVEGLLNQKIRAAKERLAEPGSELSPFAFSEFLKLRERIFRLSAHQGGL